MLTKSNDPYIAKVEAEVEGNFGSEVTALRRAAQTVTTARQTLYRSDGVPRYSEAELREREQALLAGFDVTAGWVGDSADEAITKAQADLAKLDGSDGFERLTEVERTQANERREFTREDCDLLPGPDLAKRLRAAVASGDRAQAWLFARYAGMRIDRERGRVAPELVAAFREVQQFVSDPKQGEKRHALERRIENAKYLKHSIRQARSEVDGSAAVALEQMRRQMAARF